MGHHPPVPPVPEEPKIDEEFSLRAEINHEHNSDEDFLKIDDEFVQDGLHEEEEVVNEDDPDGEERYQAHLQKKKNDKIFNNSYNTGDGGSENHEHGNTSIKLVSNHRDSHLHDPEKYRDHLDHKIFQEDIQKIIDNSPEIVDVITSEPNKKKYSKQEINFLFSTLKSKLSRGNESSRFINSIYLLDSISSLTTLEYRKIFDMLEYEYKEDLLEELNQKYRILDHHHKTNKLF